MNRVHLALIPFLLLVSSCQARTPPEGKRYAEFLAEAHARGQFNGVALVLDGGKVVYEGAFGIGSMDADDTLDLDAQFRLASVSKQFTAMAIMQLKESGKLRYDQDIRDFIPELPYNGITVRQLLHHVSGLPDYEPLMDQYWKTDLKFDDPARYTDGNPEIIRMLVAKKPPVLFKPGEKWSYSNTGYNLLATIVARASGVSFAEYTKQHIFDPASMSRTSVYDYVVGPDPQMPDRVYGFRMDWNGKDMIASDSHYLNLGAGEDGVYSTVEDLLKWDRILYTGKLVSQATLEEAFTPGVLNNGDTTDYGFGWFIQRSPTGKRMVTHSGGWLGFSTYIVRELEEDKCLVILMNNSTDYFWPMVAQLTNILYDKPYALPPLSIRALLGKDVAENGVEHAIAQYHELKTQRPKDFIHGEAELNILGYQLLWADRKDDAVAMLKLTTEEYPNSANVYDSYGDALLAKGDSAQALVNFKKAFARDTTLLATKEKIDGMEAELLEDTK
ncbi:MAG: serine hydrolase [Flavobacteriales bacterium]